MSSKKDYDKAVSRRADRRRISESVAAMLTVDPDRQREAMERATSPGLNRAAAAKELDEDAQEFALKRRGGAPAAPMKAKPYVSVEGSMSSRDRAALSHSLNRRSR